MHITSRGGAWNIVKGGSEKKKVKKNLWVTVEHHGILKKLEASGLSQSEHMRRALDDYTDKLHREGKL